MKALKVEMVDIQPMTCGQAAEAGYTAHGMSTDMGFGVTYPNGKREWIPSDVANKEFYRLSEKNDGTKILKEDVENFITDVDVMTVGDKTTVVNAHTLTGFDTVRHSSCVDPKNYSEELGKKYAMEEVINDLWSHLGFVLQWAKFGLKRR